MSEALLVCIVLAVIYLLECVAWGPAEARAFWARPRAAWSEATELFAVFGDRWRACAAGVVPGTGGVAWTESRVIPLAPAGVCACEASGGRGAPVSYEHLGRIHAEGRAVRAGSRTLGRVATAAYARALATLIEELAPLSPEARAARIQAELARMLDSRRARRTLRRYRWCARALVWPERALAVSMFVLVPVALLWRGFVAAWPEAALTLALTWCVTVLYAVRMRRLGGVLAREHAGAAPPISDHVITMVLAPPAAVRADDVVARELFGGQHGVAIARVAGSEALGRAIAGGALRELRFPLEGERAACCEAAAWSREAWGRALETWVAREFGSVEALLAAPTREADAMRTYCPRCLSQYSHAKGECDTCPGVALVRFGG